MEDATAVMWIFTHAAKKIKTIIFIALYHSMCSLLGSVCVPDPSQGLQQCSWTQGSVLVALGYDLSVLYLFQC